MVNKDPEKHKEWRRNYELKNKERISARRREYQKTHRKQNTENHRRWVENHKEKWRSYCKEYSKKYINKNAEWWANYKAQLKCSHCGEGRPECLDFHHLDPSTKEMHIASLRPRGPNRIKKALEEIKKCIVLCANCHRVEHANKRKTIKAA